MKKLLFVSFAVFMGIFIGINAFGETTNEGINTGGDIPNSIPAGVTQDSAASFSLEVDNFEYSGSLEEGESRKLMDGASTETYILNHIETDIKNSIEEAVNGCPVYNTPTVVIENTSCAYNPSGWVRLEGHVSLNGQPLNAMVLANGQYMFSSGGKMSIGDYVLTVPLDSSNSITLFTFVSGMLPYQTTFEINPITCKIEGCGQPGLPLKISNLDFPIVVKAGESYHGSVKYEGSFEFIANPMMLIKFSFPGGSIVVMNHSVPTASDCYIDFIGTITNKITGTGTDYFLLVDYDNSEDLFYNWDNNGVSNKLPQQHTIIK